MNYTIKCNRREKKEFIQICGKIELRNKIAKGDLYELSPFYHRRALLSTRILCQREKLSGNSKAFGQERKFCISGIETELYLFQGYPQILSAYGTKEKRLTQQLPPPRNVLETRGVGLHRREVISNMVAGTDIQYPVRDEDAVVQDDLPLDRRKISAFHPEKPAEERKNTQALRERRQVHDGEKHTQTG